LRVGKPTQNPSTQFNHSPGWRRVYFSKTLKNAPGTKTRSGLRSGVSHFQLIPVSL